MARDPYDGQPYYCKTCGGEPGEHTQQDFADGCKLEDIATAQMRQRRRRPGGSDLAIHTPKE